MDEIVEEKLRAMGYKEVPEKLRSMLAAWKSRQDMVRPSPLSLDAIIMCTVIYEMTSAPKKKS